VEAVQTADPVVGQAGVGDAQVVKGEPAGVAAFDRQNP
jgi:hypothetical protein